MDNVFEPVVVVSKCLLSKPCRYDGRIIVFDFMREVGGYARIRPVCPEMEIGLGFPRDPIRIVSAKGRRILYQPSTHKDLTARMENFVIEYLKSLRNADGFILKSKSPSCGLRDAKIHVGYEDDAAYTRGAGFFGCKIREFFPHAVIADENDLEKPGARRKFATDLDRNQGMAKNRMTPNGWCLTSR